MKTHSKEIINAANRYGVANLKLEAEASLVEGTTFSLDNVMEHLIYADSMNCALLKEAAMDYILENKAEVLEKMVSFDDVPRNLMRDLLAAVARGEREEGRTDGDNNVELQFNAMRISELRQKAHEKGL
jgi:CMP-N-acetylneuraminic acid synthetase